MREGETSTPDAPPTQPVRQQPAEYKTRYGRSVHKPMSTNCEPI